MIEQGLKSCKAYMVGRGSQTYGQCASFPSSADTARFQAVKQPYPQWLPYILSNGVIDARN